MLLSPQHVGFEDLKLRFKIMSPKTLDHTFVRDLTMSIQKADSRNKSFLLDYQEYDEGFVAFVGSSKGGKITGKGKIRTGKLDFEDVYFVKELKFNLFSVSQMCDKKNSVLFTETECLILSPDFKLPDANQVLLKNMVLVTKPHNKTPYELLIHRAPIISFMRPFGCPVTILNTLDHLRKFDGKADEGFLVGSKIHSDVGQEGKEKMSDQEYILLPVLNKSLDVPSSNEEVESSPKDDAGKKSIVELTCNYGEWNFSTPFPSNAVGSSFSHLAALDDFSKMPNLEDTRIFDDAFDNRDEGAEADYNNLETVISMEPKEVTQDLDDESWVEAMQEELLRFKLLNVQTLVDLLHGNRDIGTKWVYKNKRDQRGIVQTIVANSTIEVEYIAASSYCGQLLWLQNQLLDYGYNFIQTKIHVDNESAICVVKNPVYHSKTKHIKIRHHFIRDSYEKRLIEMVKIHTDSNIADLLTKAFDVTRIQFFVTSIDKKELAIPGQTKTGKEFSNSLMAEPFSSLNNSMANLKFVDQHNMVVYLEKSDDHIEFHQIVDFISLCSITYALTPEWSRFVTIVKQQHKLDEVSYHKLFDILKQYQKEVNELRAARLARNANPLALVATAQENRDPYYQTPKSQKSYAPSSKPSIPTRTHTTTKYKGKEIAKPITPPSESASEEDNDPIQAQRDKDITSSNSRNKNVDTTPRYKNDNQSGQFGNHRTINVAGARENVGSLVVQQYGIQCFNCKEFGHFAKECKKTKGLKIPHTDEEIDEQELEAHYRYMAKIQELRIEEKETMCKFLFNKMKKIFRRGTCKKLRIVWCLSWRAPPRVPSNLDNWDTASSQLFDIAIHDFYRLFNKMKLVIQLESF
uniref:Putative ribonuclease H-like domain-containing protein n=1 Tax=Tanacetum cinerariifolium TaxID=118510 RepID=A0A6L2LAH1_TANCI|nr:putative ribonuclease H-like domain-containing protein [Tanacetum cinerariifolium]